MKIHAAELSETRGHIFLRSVLVTKSARGYTLNDYYSMKDPSIEQLSKYSHLRIICGGAELVSDLLEIPKGMRSGHLRVFCVKKLENLLEKGAGYRCVSTSERGGLHRVYLAPENSFESDLLKAERVKRRIKSLTPAPFALTAISGLCCQEKTVFHVYLSGGQTIIVLSRGSSLLYSRTAAEDAGSISLTYSYIVKNLRVTPEAVLLSGTDAEDENLKKSIIEITGIEPFEPRAADIIDNCPQHIFREYIIPLGGAVAEKPADFSTFKIKKERLISRILLPVNSALIILLFFFVLSAIRLNTAVSELKSRTEHYSAKIEREKKEASKLTAGSGVQKYQLRYLTEIERKKMSPLRALPTLIPILELTGFDRVIMEENGKTAIASTVNFDSINDMTLFSENLEREIQKTGLKIKNSSKYDTGKLSAAIRLITEGGR